MSRLRVQYGINSTRTSTGNANSTRFRLMQFQALPVAVTHAINLHHYSLSTVLLTLLIIQNSSPLTFSMQQENPFASERGQKPSNLPQDRSAHSHDTFLIEKSSAGHLTSFQVIEILNKREEQKEEWTAAVVAEKFKIDPQDAENLMKFFSSYKQVPSKKPPSVTLK